LAPAEEEEEEEEEEEGVEEDEKKKCSHIFKYIKYIYIKMLFFFS